MSGFLRLPQRSLFIVAAGRTQEQIALRQIRRPDQVTLADEFLEPLPRQDDLLEREPFTVAAYRLVAGRFGDRRAAVCSEYA
jgi:hypothetical protein